jgi:hypothetical protein
MSLPVASVDELIALLVEKGVQLWGRRRKSSHPSGRTPLTRPAVEATRLAVSPRPEGIRRQRWLAAMRQARTLQ